MEAALKDDMVSIYWQMGIWCLLCCHAFCYMRKMFSDGH